MGEPAARQIEFRVKGHFERIVRVGHTDLNAAIAQLDLDGSGACQNAWNKIQFNGGSGLRAYISFMHIGQRIEQNMKVHAHGRDRRFDLLPLIVTVIVAVVGAAGIFNDLRPADDSQGSGNASAITAAAVSRAGAIEIPSNSRAPAGANEGVSA